MEIYKPQVGTKEMELRLNLNEWLWMNCSRSNTSCESENQDKGEMQDNSHSERFSSVSIWYRDSLLWLAAIESLFSVVKPSRETFNCAKWDVDDKTSVVFLRITGESCLDWFDNYRWRFVWLQTCHLTDVWKLRVALLLSKRVISLRLHWLVISTDQPISGVCEALSTNQTQACTKINW